MARNPGVMQVSDGGRELDAKVLLDAVTKQQVAEGIKSTDPSARIGSETAAEANARIVQGYKDQPKPDLTVEGAAAGATIKFVRTGDGGVGEYREVFPIGTAIPSTRTTTSGNVYDAQGNLVSGSGLKTSTATSTASTVDPLAGKTPDQIAAYNNAKGVAQSFVDAYGGQLSDYFNATTGIVTKPTDAVINKKFTTPKVLKPGDPGYVAPSGDNTTPKAPVGTPPAYIYDAATKTWKMPPKPTGPGTWVFDANNGWVDTTVVPGSSGMRADGTKTLALDTFKNTLALLFGAKEASQPWVTALYTSASKFYNTGSTIDESINLSLQDIRYNKDLKPFTDRFKGIYALTDRLAGGEAIEVPTVAEYFKSESSMGDILRAAGMGELATQDFLGDIIGRGKSVLEVTNLITDTFDRIDNAPSALKADLLRAFPGADRTSIAKAMLTGVAGAAELTKKVKAISVQSAAKTQGITIDDLTSQDIAGRGYDYNKSLEGFATVAQTSERGSALGRISGIDLTQQEVIASAFGSSAAADEKIRKIREEEANRFNASSGRLASQNRTAGLI